MVQFYGAISTHEVSKVSAARPKKIQASKEAMCQTYIELEEKIDYNFQGTQELKINKWIGSSSD